MSTAKTKKQKEPFVIKNPFSEEFMVAWNYWKKFKFEVFRFSYKPLGEQHAINYLYEIAGGDENTAKLIIKQSLGLNYQGLFELKNKNVNGAGKSTAGSSGSATRESVNDVYNEKFGSGKQNGAQSSNKAL